ncbi:MAG: methylenetetrahydrofolate--tRNA-(uracil(54)-C(5))-methyltransferase (FADH(2)-oxidizing) TrmFO [Firmicutes bacterium]|nr:methylenetetrahydrofolate--tRNA-(uracil(54)-C(5))-methyltransferase (FADH(2)-oxidizing) TrmFO [Bacillota bacterium]
MNLETIKVIGAGLAGCEAAWQLAERGCKVELYEMRPGTMTPAHKTAAMAELVCSNSLGASNIDTASGLLKFELQQLGSLILQCAEAAMVPAGGALAVDRSQFSRLVSERIENHPNITVVSEVVTEVPKPPAIIATGPLTDDRFAQQLTQLLGTEMLAFYDAAAPIVYAESVDFSKAFWGARYGKGGDDYLNCPLTEDQYQAFYEQLVNARQVELHDFERRFFEHCLPVEEMARRGYQTLTFGPLKPVGLTDPASGEKPYAVVQLRKEDVHGQLLNMVGFQTNLLWPEQKRVFRMIPALREAEFARLGVMHRNSYVNAPKVLAKNYELRRHPGLYIAGQLSGVEGYVESVSSGLVAALDLAAKINGRSEINLPPETLVGSLTQFITTVNKNFQPMNANFGLLPPVDKRGGKRERRKAAAHRARENIFLFAKNLNN